MKKYLNLGCGKDIRKSTDEIEWTNIDSIDIPGITLRLNLDHGRWPLDDNTYDYVDCKMILEHLHNWPQALEEIWRISKPGAIIEIQVPLFPSMYAATDPTHKSFFTYLTFDYFTPENSLNYYTKARFHIRKKYIRFSWNKIRNLLAIPINWFPIFYSRYLSFIFPANSLEIKLEVIK